MSNCDSSVCSDDVTQFAAYSDEMNRNAARRSVIVRAGNNAGGGRSTRLQQTPTSMYKQQSNSCANSDCVPSVSKRRNNRRDSFGVEPQKPDYFRMRGEDEPRCQSPMEQSEKCNKHLYNFVKEANSKCDQTDSGYNSVVDVEQCLERDIVMTIDRQGTWSSGDGHGEARHGEHSSLRNFESTSRSTPHPFVSPRKPGCRSAQEEDEMRLGNGHSVNKDRPPRTGQSLHTDHRYKPYSECPSSSSSISTHHLPPQDHTAGRVMNLTNDLNHQHHHNLQYHRCVSETSLASNVYSTYSTTPPRLLIHHRDSYSLTDADSDGDTALHIAVAREDEGSVNYLTHSMLTRHISLDMCNRRRQTSLHIAVITGHLNIIKKLLSAGACPLVPDQQGNTAVHLAVQCSSLETIETLLECSIAFKAFRRRNYNGFTPLHLAVFRKDLNVISLLAAKGSDCNCVDGTSGRTPLFHAVANGQDDAVAILINFGASVNLPNYAGVTPLVVATDKRLKNISRLLISKGATMSARDEV